MRRAPVIVCFVALAGPAAGGPVEAAGLRGAGGGAGFATGGRGLHVSSVRPSGARAHVAGHRLGALRPHGGLAQGFGWGGFGYSYVGDDGWYPGSGAGYPVGSPSDVAPGVVAAVGIRAAPVSPPLVYVLESVGAGARARHPRWRGPKVVARGGTGWTELASEEPPGWNGSGARVIHLRVARGR